MLLSGAWSLFLTHSDACVTTVDASSRLWRWIYAGLYVRQAGTRLPDPAIYDTIRSRATTENEQSHGTWFHYSCRTAVQRPMAASSYLEEDTKQPNPAASTARPSFQGCAQPRGQGQSPASPYKRTSTCRHRYGTCTTSRRISMRVTVPPYRDATTLDTSGQQPL